ncbi:hypothetical protein M3Y99_01963500 [Aphelenchoides fujianensis]|nr:hypothetical protein M3Y99_01963500 [Aphelenchoides fujianensis]
MDDDPMTDDDGSPPPHFAPQAFNIVNVLSSSQSGSLPPHSCRNDEEMGGQSSGFDSQASNFSEDEDLAVAHLQKLYPLVDQTKTPLPRFWNPADKCRLLRLSSDNLKVQYNGKGESHRDAAAVRANCSIPRNCGIFYFEIDVLEKGESGFIGIGLCEKNVDINRLPGWETTSYGYHGDDGNFFASSGKGVTFGPKFGTGDTVGCGINFITRSIFFTKNGVNLGTAAVNISIDHPLYPTVGMQTPGEVVATNFGQKPFFYKLEKDVQETEEKTIKHINNTTLPAEKSVWMAKTISSWLAYSGYSRTLAVFNASTATFHRGAVEELQERRLIMQLVVDRDIGEAIRRTNALSRAVFEDNKQLALLLMIQEFLEFYASIKVPTQFANQPAVSLSSDVNMLDEASASGDALLRETGEQEGEASDRNEMTGDLLRETEDVAIGHLMRVSRANAGFEQEGAPAATNGHALHSSNGFAATNGNSHQPAGMNGTAATSTNIIAEEDGYSSEFSRSSLESDWEMEQSGRQDSPDGNALSEQELQQLIAMGQRISTFATTLKNAPPELLSRMDDAFSIVCYQKPYDCPKSYLLSPSFRKFLARALNSAIISSTSAEAVQAPDALFRKAKELRLRALKSGAAAAAIAIEKRIFDPIRP